MMDSTLKIFKYPLISVIIKLPVGAKILHIDIQKDILCAWALVNPNRVEIDTIRVIGTGHSMPDYRFYWKFLGTHLLRDGALVFHVYDIRP